MLVDSSKNTIVNKEQVELLEGHMLNMPQVDCPVVHHFAPGICIREVTLPKGAFAIGHEQKFEHMNIMIKGAVLMINDDGSSNILRAPMIFVGKPGRKVGLILEETVWQNVYATNLRDVESVESFFIDKSKTYEAHQELTKKIEYISRNEDREDFERVSRLSGFSIEEIRKQSENESDQIEMPYNTAAKFCVRKSSIEGYGVFLSSPAEEGEIIAPARIDGMRTPAGRFTNHSKSPNAKFIMNDKGDIYLVASRKINGCKGGDNGEEVTIDYRQALSLSGIKLLEEAEV